MCVGLCIIEASLVNQTTPYSLLDVLHQDGGGLVMSLIRRRVQYRSKFQDLHDHRRIYVIKSDAYKMSMLIHG